MSQNRMITRSMIKSRQKSDSDESNKECSVNIVKTAHTCESCLGIPSRKLYKLRNIVSNGTTHYTLSDICLSVWSRISFTKYGKKDVKMYQNDVQLRKYLHKLEHIQEIYLYLYILSKDPNFDIRSLCKIYTTAYERAKTIMEDHKIRYKAVSKQIITKEVQSRVKYFEDTLDTYIQYIDRLGAIKQPKSCVKISYNRCV